MTKNKDYKAYQKPYPIRVDGAGEVSERTKSLYMPNSSLLEHVEGALRTSGGTMGPPRRRRRNESN